MVALPSIQEEEGEDDEQKRVSVEWSIQTLVEAANMLRAKRDVEFNYTLYARKQKISHGEAYKVGGIVKQMLAASTGDDLAESVYGANIRVLTQVSDSGKSPTNQSARK